MRKRSRRLYVVMTEIPYYREVEVMARSKKEAIVEGKRLLGYAIDEGTLEVEEIESEVDDG